jgi:bifunctional non-homologous end joining protein LigD
MPDRLDPYREKRDPRVTPEPFGEPRPAGSAPLAPRPFVVQEHAARRLHWDFRLELDGTLRSWAVPKGPSYDPADKRLAVEVEDHPVEYAEFEGIIPAGNYGAGKVIVWDRGAWRPHGDPRAGLAEGKLVFDLAGYKLRGEWTLVRTRRVASGKQQWLLLKHRDALAGPGHPLPEESVLTGRRVEDVAAGDGRGEAALAEARRLGARPRRRGVRERPMRAIPASALPSGPGWIFEIAAGGRRTLARREGERVELWSEGEDVAARFPEVTLALSLLPTDAVIDGELVVLGPDARPSPDALRRRAGLRRRADVARGAVESPATLLAFDLLALGPLDVRPLPLRDRKRLLAAIVPHLGPLRYAEDVGGSGEALLAEVTARGAGGVVARRTGSAYRAGPSGDWREVGAAVGGPPDRARRRVPRRRVH